jgi:hypothetical protein
MVPILGIQPNLSRRVGRMEKNLILLSLIRLRGTSSRMETRSGGGGRGGYSENSTVHLINNHWGGGGGRTERRR